MELTVLLDENTTLNDCFREKKDWRACKDEVSPDEMSRASARAYHGWSLLLWSSLIINVKYTDANTGRRIDGGVQAMLEEGGQ